MTEKWAFPCMLMAEYYVSLRQHKTSYEKVRKASKLLNTFSKNGYSRPRSGNVPTYFPNGRSPTALVGSHLKFFIHMGSGQCSL
jgi:hypothetical protein